MGLLLNVPFSEKDEAKALGACWNPKQKKWYAPHPEKYPRFFKWMELPKEWDVCHIIIDHIYIVETSRKCYKCGKDTRVMAFALDNYYTIWNPKEPPISDISECFDLYSCNNIEDIHIFPILPNSCIPPKIWNELDDTFHFHIGYSRTAGYYRANHCLHCNSIQGAWYLFAEDDSPFYNNDVKIYKKIYLDNDLIVDDLGVSSMWT